MARKIRWRRKPCPYCRDLITTNALGRAAHIRFCTPEKAQERHRKQDEAARQRLRRP